MPAIFQSRTFLEKANLWLQIWQTQSITSFLTHSQVKVDISLNGTHLFASGGVEAWLILESFLFLDAVFFYVLPHGNVRE